MTSNNIRHISAHAYCRIFDTPPPFSCSSRRFRCRRAEYRLMPPARRRHARAMMPIPACLRSPRHFRRASAFQHWSVSSAIYAGQDCGSLAPRKCHDRVGDDDADEALKQRKITAGLYVIWRGANAFMPPPRLGHFTHGRERARRAELPWRMMRARARELRTSSMMRGAFDAAQFLAWLLTRLAIRLPSPPISTALDTTRLRGWLRVAELLGQIDSRRAMQAFSPRRRRASASERPAPPPHYRCRLDSTLIQQCLCARHEYAASSLFRYRRPPRRRRGHGPGMRLGDVGAGRTGARRQTPIGSALSDFFADCEESMPAEGCDAMPVEDFDTGFDAPDGQPPTCFAAIGVATISCACLSAGARRRGYFRFFAISPLSLPCWPRFPRAADNADGLGCGGGRASFRRRASHDTIPYTSPAALAHRPSRARCFAFALLISPPPSTSPDGGDRHSHLVYQEQNNTTSATTSPPWSGISSRDSRRYIYVDADMRADARFAGPIRRRNYMP